MLISFKFANLIIDYVMVGTASQTTKPISSKQTQPIISAIQFETCVIKACLHIKVIFSSDTYV